MHLRVRGPGVPEELLSVLAAVTDRARLRPADLVHDPDARTVRVPIVRLPLLRRRRARGNVHDAESPVHAILTVRGVVTCEVHDTEELGEVALLFGVTVRGDRIHLSSAEERSGETSYAIELTVSELDVEIADEAG